MKSAGKARNNGLYRHIRTSKEIIRNLLNDYCKNKSLRESIKTVFLILLPFGSSFHPTVVVPRHEIQPKDAKPHWQCCILQPAQ